ncbi:golgin-84 isoform X1 [Iris pallida]|uniref:Golgin-84 isoform X1 n=1 Tax=Iris pallida TaxID=29817 RepID=A0AAX6F679_IRIPA|nr:golgin-84 isoform X1 [Iris pallida]
MASWLKVAEDLLEVVDRRAKLVVNELADERSDSQPSAPNGQQVKARRKKSKEKGHLTQSSTDTTIRSNVEQEQQSVQLSAPDVKIDRAETYPSETPLGDGTNKEEEVSVEQLYGANKDTVISDIAPSGVAHTDKRGTDIDIAESVPVTENEIEIPSSSTNDGTINTNSEDLQESSSSALMDKENETTNGDPADANPNIGSVAEATSLKVDQVSTESETVERHVTTDGQENESVPLLEPSPNTNKQQEQKTESSPNMNKQQEHKTESSPNMHKQQEHKTESSPNMHNQQEHKTGTTSVKVQEQLDEAQGLLKSAVSTGQSKEARLARVCAGLSSRLQEYKSENAQLEELLILERERATSYEAHIKQLQQDLSASKLEVARVESNMSEALAAKNSEIESLVGSMGALKKQASASEGKLASLQENMEAIMRNRELTETRMMQALREELASAERRAEEERVAHNATKMAAVEREVELEHRAVEASNALARIQRTAEESTSRATELEHKVALLEVECASLTQELQDMEARNRRGQKKTSEEANQILQMQAWQEEVERARQG